MKLKSYQELEDDRVQELETGIFEQDKCAHCGVTKQHPGEGDYLPDGRWFHSWNCRTELIGAGKLFTAKITTWEKIMDFFRQTALLEETKMISIMRSTWRFLPKEAPVMRLNNLGPPKELHKETRSFVKDLKDGKLSEKQIRDFQMKYSARYIAHLLESGDADQEIQYILRVLRSGKNVVLMCICDPDQFCHRVLLKEWLATIPDIKERIVGELKL